MDRSSPLGKGVVLVSGLLPAEGSRDVLTGLDAPLGMVIGLGGESGVGVTDRWFVCVCVERGETGRDMEPREWGWVRREGAGWQAGAGVQWGDVWFGWRAGEWVGDGANGARRHLRIRSVTTACCPYRQAMLSAVSPSSPFSSTPTWDASGEGHEHTPLVFFFPFFSLPARVLCRTAHLHHSESTGQRQRLETTRRNARHPVGKPAVRSISDFLPPPPAGRNGDAPCQATPRRQILNHGPAQLAPIKQSGLAQGATAQCPWHRRDAPTCIHGYLTVLASAQC
eukprot:scaffold32381_cov107-Isochrysis_galbana.AAC.2